MMHFCGFLAWYPEASTLGPQGRLHKSSARGVSVRLSTRQSRFKAVAAGQGGNFGGMWGRSQSFTMWPRSRHLPKAESESVIWMELTNALDPHCGPISVDRIGCTLERGAGLRCSRFTLQGLRRSQCD